MEIIYLNYKDLKIEYPLEDNFIKVCEIGKYFKKYIHNWIQSNNFIEVCYGVNKIITGEEIKDWNTLNIKDKRIYLKNNNYFNFILEEKEIKISKKIFLDYTDWCGDCEFKYWMRKQVGNINKSLKINDEDKLNESVIANENNLSYRIVLWENICKQNSKLNIEEPIINLINNRSKVRRIDFVERKKGKVVIYELKFNKINLNMVTTTIADKQYIDLCEQVFGLPVELVFIGYKDIDEYAINLINRLNNVSYISVQNFVKKLYELGLRTKWKNNKKHLKSRIFDKTFINLFDIDFINTIKNDN